MSASLDYAVLRAKQEWEHSHSRGILAQLVRCINRARKIRGVWICQHATGDWSMARCTMEPLRVWFYDGNGMVMVSGLAKVELGEAIASITPVIRFCPDEDEQRMIYQESTGFLAGFGCIMKYSNGEWVTELEGWIS